MHKLFVAIGLAGLCVGAHVVLANPVPISDYNKSEIAIYCDKKGGTYSTTYRVLLRGVIGAHTKEAMSNAIRQVNAFRKIQAKPPEDLSSGAPTKILQGLQISQVGRPAVLVVRLLLG
jgi:hypothetical protein